MSLGRLNRQPTASPRGQSSRGRLRTAFRNCLGPVVATWCLTGGGATGFHAWAAPPTAGLPAVSQPDNLGRTAAAESSGDPLNSCERAGAAMEHASGLPPGLLLAIGRVESGRWDSLRGRVAAWPWTINAAGKGQWFTTRDAAARTVQDLLNGGTRSIDVGCFQINLLWHPTAFASLEQAFDPDANAAYAARFLLALFGQTGSWDAAVEAYHSADPALGYAYRQQVFSTWDAAAAVAAVPPVRLRATPLVALASRPITMPMVIAGVQVWTPMPLGSAAGVVVMPGSPAPERQPQAQNQATPPLPAVLYHTLPPGLLPVRAARVRPRAPKLLSAEVVRPQ